MQAGLDRLDQQIIVKIQGPGFYDDGIWTPGATTDYPAWAGYKDKGIASDVDVDGVRETGQHRFKVRFNQTFLDSTPALDIRVMFRGSLYTVKEILEDRTERSRFLFLDCERKDHHP